MAILLNVKWVDKSDQLELHQRIKRIGGNSGQFQWEHTLVQAIEAIERDLFTYYVQKEARILKLDIGLAPNGHKYLKINADGEQPMPLLEELPARPRLLAG